MEIEGGSIGRCSVLPKSRVQAQSRHHDEASSKDVGSNKYIKDEQVSWVYPSPLGSSLL